jgi:hypothetical protein
VLRALRTATAGPVSADTSRVRRIVVLIIVGLSRLLLCRPVTGDPITAAM